MRPPVFALVSLMLVLGLVGMSNFSKDLRTVQVVGLLGSGACLGVALVLLIFRITGVIKGKDGGASGSEAAGERERRQPWGRDPHPLHGGVFAAGGGDSQREHDGEHRGGTNGRPDNTGFGLGSGGPDPSAEASRHPVSHSTSAARNSG